MTVNEFFKQRNNPEGIGVGFKKGEQSAQHLALLTSIRIGVDGTKQTVQQAVHRVLTRFQNPTPFCRLH